MRYLTLLLAMACVHVPVELPKLDDRILRVQVRSTQDDQMPEPHIAGYSGGGLISPIRGAVTKTILGSGAINLSGVGSSPTFSGIVYSGVGFLKSGGGSASGILWSGASVDVYVAGNLAEHCDSGTGKCQFDNYGITSKQVDISAVLPVLYAPSATGKFQWTSNISSANANSTTAPAFEIIPQNALDATDLILAVRTSVAGDLFTIAQNGTVTAGQFNVSGNGFIVGANSGVKLAGYAMTNTAPTISSGFGTSPSVATNNGSAAFTVNVGTGGVATSGVIGLPAATNGWVCTCDDLTQASTSPNKTIMTATSTTSCTVTNKVMSTGAAAAWAASDILHCSAMGR